MTKAPTPEEISDFLAEQRDEAPADLQPVFITLDDLWDRKLWHQLTDQVLEFFATQASGPYRLPLYRQFVLSFADKINQLKLVKIALLASQQCTDDQERSAFLDALAERVNKPDFAEAHVYAITELASVYLRSGQDKKARQRLDEAQETLDNFDFVENVVHASFYRVNADYFQSKSDYTSYYRNSLLYLACISETELSPEQEQRRAYDLSVAALVSDSIYNFGELLLHPILNVLQKPNAHSWLRDLLFAFNRGDLGAFERLSNNLSKDRQLEEHRGFLFQKISLAALTELVFKRPPHDRAMSFKAISHETKVKADEIEHLIMKALSLGLLRGKIDQVAGIAKINWVQPKVLERSQIEGMRVRLKEWDSNVNDLGHYIENVGQDVWASLSIAASQADLRPQNRAALLKSFSSASFLRTELPTDPVAAQPSQSPTSPPQSSSPSEEQPFSNPFPQVPAGLKTRTMVGTVSHVHTNTAYVEHNEQIWDKRLQKHFKHTAHNLVHDPVALLRVGDVVRYSAFTPAERAAREKRRGDILDYEEARGVDTGRGQSVTRRGFVVPDGKRLVMVGAKLEAIPKRQRNTKGVRYVVREVVSPFGSPITQRFDGMKKAGWLLDLQK
ncbi:hypothetical protein DV737_g388, partial [Chaetothyriales sp. CBS 132003]